MRSLAMSAYFALALFAAAQIPPMEEYRCVFQQHCGPVSQACWGTGHKWGQSYCTYCDGNAQQDLCQKAEKGSCQYIDKNQSCGIKLQGICSGGPVGTCTPPVPPTFPLPGACGVPMCETDGAGPTPAHVASSQRGESCLFG